MKLDALDHPKTHALTGYLASTRPTVIGHLELLWAFVGKHAPRGDVGKHPDESIARAADWQGDPADFVTALVLAKFLDDDTKHRLVVHDWHEHAPGWVRAKLKGLRQDFVKPTGSPPGSPPRCRPSIQGKGREGKGSVYTAEAHPGGQPGLEPGDTHRPQSPTGHPPEWINGGKVPPTLDDSERMTAFAMIRERYPKRAGRGHNWILAERAWGKLIDEGETDPVTLQAGVDRYRAYVDGGGVSSDAFVLGADQFFAAVDRPWQNAWELPTQLRSGSGRKTFDDYRRETGSTAEPPEGAEL